ncbi:TlpA family protein disulfide reductase [Solitalea lacus]|uniref:TlpA family protein disulfide reductase n=1 Tax=Solitalea lacus TaxID=2911172 RepID=UPI001EDB8456|nr:TlpA family protein disulfide reductase [Solitalea lacus]UKJ05888.1 TlpA family protein disulfide reductase [Solitalea lacus]
MKSVLVTFIILLQTCFASAQQVKPVKVNELNQRISGGKDTTFVINFWATWCAPCVKEIPHFAELQKEFKTEKLKVILVSMDFKSKLESIVIPFVQQKNIPLEIFLLDEKDQGVAIDKIDPTWSGALPATLIVNNSKSVRNFYERDFTYDELKHTYLTIKN